MGDHPNLVKGLDLKARELKLSGKNKTARSLTEYDCYLETDYSRFDLCISAAYLASVERIFLTCAFQGDSWLLDLVACLGTTRGINELGLSYNVLGTRCSGDAHTSIANGLINHFNTWLAFVELPPNSWVSFHEGDDGIIGVSSNYREQAIHNLHLLPVLGFQLKLLVHSNLDDATFCGRFLVNQLHGVDSYCDLRRSLAKIHTINSDGDPEALLLAKMISYYHTDKSTPVIGTLSTVIIRILLPKVTTRRLTRAMNHLKRDWWFAQKHKDLVFRESYPLHQPELLVRALVADRCDIDIGLQYAFESYYLSWLELGHIPSIVDRLPGEWTTKLKMHVHGDPANWIA